VNRKHVSSFVDFILGDGGEGGILRKCGSLYLPGRGHTLIKLKVWFYNIFFCQGGFIIYFFVKVVLRYFFVKVVLQYHHNEDNKWMCF